MIRKAEVDVEYLSVLVDTFPFSWSNSWSECQHAEAIFLKSVVWAFVANNVFLQSLQYWKCQLKLFYVFLMFSYNEMLKKALSATLANPFKVHDLVVGPNTLSLIKG